MDPVRRKWLSRLIRLAACVAAGAYLYHKVSWYDWVTLPVPPEQRLRLIGPPNENPLRLRDPDGAEVRLANPPGGPHPTIELGLRSLVRRMRPDMAAWAMLALAPTTFLLAWRLRMLLAMQGLPISGRDAVLLTFAGNFFNFALPGTTGGDLYKAYHVARGGHKRTEGITVVLLDRVIGLVSFVLLAGFSIGLSLIGGRVSIGPLGKIVGLLLVALVVGTIIFFSRRFRRWIGYESLLRRLPLADKLRRVDQTAFSFRYHPRQTALALLVTILSHFLLALGVMCLARALGMPRSRESLTAASFATFYLANLLAVTVGYLLAAVPVSFQGFGLLEAVFLRVLARGGFGTESQVVALCLGTRAMQLLWALPGAMVPWLGLKRPAVDLSIDDDEPEPELAGSSPSRHVKR